MEINSVLKWIKEFDIRIKAMRNFLTETAFMFTTAFNNKID